MLTLNVISDYYYDREIIGSSFHADQWNALVSAMEPAEQTLEGLLAQYHLTNTKYVMKQLLKSGVLTLAMVEQAIKDEQAEDEAEMAAKQAEQEAEILKQSNMESEEEDG